MLAYIICDNTIDADAVITIMINRCGLYLLYQQGAALKVAPVYQVKWSLEYPNEGKTYVVPGQISVRGGEPFVDEYGEKRYEVFYFQENTAIGHIPESDLLFFK